jgi:hypothetical protein
MRVKASGWAPRWAGAHPAGVGHVSARDGLQAFCFPIGDLRGSQPTLSAALATCGLKRLLNGIRLSGINFSRNPYAPSLLRSGELVAVGSGGPQSWELQGQF